MIKPLSDCFLYAILDTTYVRKRDLRDVARQLCDGGADILQLRVKKGDQDEIWNLAETIMPVTDMAGIALVINDYPRVAMQVRAPFCHLGQEDFFHAGYSHVTQLFPGTYQIQTGLSTHNPEQAKSAIAAGAAYLGVGPVFATATKPGVEPVTLDYVKWAAANVTIPWFAIGGINLDNLAQVIAAGARRICAVSAILTAPDIVETCQAFKGRIMSAGKS